MPPAQPDVDGPFGSAGSFFEYKPSGGSFAANPPFVDCLMDACARHVLALLDAQGLAGNSALSFVVVLYALFSASSGAYAPEARQRAFAKELRREARENRCEPCAP